MATGTFSCGALSKDPFMVLRGEVQFFSQDINSPDTKNLAYKMDLMGTDGQLLHFNGYKVIDSSIAFSVSTTWKATTTLYVTLTRPNGSVVGRGILTISLRNFKSEMLSFGGSGTTVLGRLGAATHFVSWFMGQTLGFFFSPFRVLQYPAISATGYYPKTPPAEVVTLTAADGVKVMLHVWRPQSSRGGILRSRSRTAVTSGKPPLLFVPGAAVDQQVSQSLVSLGLMLTMEDLRTTNHPERLCVLFPCSRIYHLHPYASRRQDKGCRTRLHYIRRPSRC